MLHLPTLIILSFVTCTIVTLLLLLMRASLGTAAAGALTWVVGDLAFTASRFFTLVERHAGLLPWTIPPLGSDLPLAIVPGTLMLVATWCHRCALRRADGAVLPVRRCAIQIALIVAAWLIVSTQVESFETRMRLLSVGLICNLAMVMAATWPLARRFWGARVIFGLALVSVLASVARATGMAPEPGVSGSNDLSGLFMLNIGASLAVTMCFVVVLQEKVRQSILQASVTDPLTGLYNRRGVLALLERDLDRARRDTSPLSVALFDLDHFKKVNDTHGHKAGDAVLAGFAECLRAETRRGDVVGRWGGEEFVIAMPDTDAVAAAQVANRVRRAFRERSWPFGMRSITVSAGVAATVAARADSDHLIDLADQRLYLAKTTRDTVCASDLTQDAAQPTPHPQAA